MNAIRGATVNGSTEFFQTTPVLFRPHVVSLSPNESLSRRTVSGRLPDTRRSGQRPTGKRATVRNPEKEKPMPQGPFSVPWFDGNIGDNDYGVRGAGRLAEKETLRRGARPTNRRLNFRIDIIFPGQLTLLDYRAPPRTKDRNRFPFGSVIFNLFAPGGAGASEMYEMIWLNPAVTLSRTNAYAVTAKSKCILEWIKVFTKMRATRSPGTNIRHESVACREKKIYRV